MYDEKRSWRTCTDLAIVLKFCWVYFLNKNRNYHCAEILTCLFLVGVEKVCFSPRLLCFYSFHENHIIVSSSSLFYVSAVLSCLGNPDNSLGEQGVHTVSANWPGGLGPWLRSPPIVQQYCTDLSLDLPERSQVKRLVCSFTGAGLKASALTCEA